MEYTEPAALAQFATASTKDMVVRVVRRSARGTGLDGEGVCLVVLGGGEGDVTMAARDVFHCGCDQGRG